MVITDDALLLSEDEIQMLKQDMYPLTDYGNIVFYSTQDGDRDYARKAHDYYYQHFQDNSGTLLLIDMYNRKVYIHSDGSNYSIITSGKAEIITDNIYRYLTNGQYYKGAQIAFSQALSLLERQKNCRTNEISKISAATNEEIIKKSKVKFLMNKVDVIKTGTRRVYSPSSSSSGGHSSGGGHSAGHSSHSSHSSGGGGGHSF